MNYLGINKEEMVGNSIQNQHSNFILKKSVFDFSFSTASVKKIVKNNLYIGAKSHLYTYSHP